MTRSRAAAWILCVAVGLLLGGLSLVGVTDAQGFVRVAPEAITWIPVAGGLGAEMAVIEGDPAKPGIYVIRMKFPPGVMSAPHVHPFDRHAVVLKGTWWTGTGTEFTPDGTVPLKPGAYMKHPARAAHFDGAKNEETIVQIVGEGPTASTPIHPEGGDFVYSMKP
jgi:quercetin dioxygenase-like cupin family protein